MKIAIIGVGAIGGYVGTRLALAGEDVTFIARGASLEALRTRGLRLVHTHLKGEPLTRDDLTDLALLRLDLIVAIEAADNRAVGLELKADDDLHLPLQALDYWTRIRMLHRAGEIARRGYFPGVELSPEDPLLTCVAPALHIHPANETVFRAFAPGVPWKLIAVDEHWRNDCRVLLRKHPTMSS